jgi:hypothetical protein
MTEYVLLIRMDGSCNYNLVRNQEDIRVAFEGTRDAKICTMVYCDGAATWLGPCDTTYDMIPVNGRAVDAVKD